MMVRLRDGSTFTVPAKGQLFSFSEGVHGEAGETMMFCVPKLDALRIEQPALWETIEVDIVADDAAMIIAQRGIEIPALKRMSRARMEEPGLAVFRANGSFLLVDGNHRYVKRHMARRATMVFHTCRTPTWHAALLDLDATRRAWESEP
jgi:hypothetical protein